MQNKYFLYFLNILLISFEFMNATYAPQNGNEENNPLIDDVKIRFNQIPIYSSPLGAWAHNIIEYPDYTYKHSDQIEDFWPNSNQFQSIARLPSHLELGDYIFLCGGNTRTKTVDLFVVKISNQDYPIWFSNLYSGFKDKNNFGKPKNTDDCFIKHIILEKKHYYQSGGIGICGKYLAIPMSSDHGTKISFYDISNPISLEKVGSSIRRQNCLENCSVSMIRLKCGHFLLALWSDMFGLYFYLSKGKTLENGFNEISHTEIGFFRYFKFSYHNISLIQDFNHHVFLIGTRNLSEDTTKDCLENIADLFSLKKEKDNAVTIRFIGRKIFPAHKTSSFNSCSVYIPNSENIWLYSCNNFLCENNPSTCNNYITSGNPKLFITFDQYGRINNSL